MANFFGIVIGVLVLVAVSSANICNVCDCQPNRNDVFSIICDGNSTKNLQITSSMMINGVSSTTMMVIKNYQVISIEKNSFGQLGALETLMIQNCIHLYLATGTFANLQSLLLNQVQDIVFDEMALMGARGIKNILIKGSNIQKLSQYSLFDVKGLNKLELSGVNIGKVYGKACNVTAKSVVIVNSVINYTETNGIIIHAEKFLLKKSIFNAMEVNSINIVTKYQTMVHRNEFKGFFELNITSPFVEMLDNKFEKFNSNAVQSVEMKRFYNNAIQDSDLSRLLQGADFRDFYDNSFECVCGMNLLNNTKSSRNFNILKRNFCIVNCTINLYEFEVESYSLCMKDGHVDVSNFCNYERYMRGSLEKTVIRDGSTEKAENDNSTSSRIQPRFLGFGVIDNSSPRVGVEFGLMVIAVAFLKYFY